MLNVLRAGGKRTKAIWWALIVITVVTFLGGFVFLLGSGLSSGFSAKASGAVGTVNDEAVSRNEFMNTLGEQRANYKRQYGTDASDRDAKMLEVQAWRSLVYQRLLSQQAKSAGMSVGDAEVVLALKTTPPSMLQNEPSFQTNGQFDYAKYQQALSDPNNNWAPWGYPDNHVHHLDPGCIHRRARFADRIPRTGPLPRRAPVRRKGAALLRGFWHAVMAPQVRRRPDGVGDFSVPAGRLRQDA